MSTTYELYKESDDHTLVTMLLMADDQEASLTEAEADDAERAERLRALLAEARRDAEQYSGATTASADLEDEQAEDETSENLIMTDDGQILDGSYRFVVNVADYLMLYQGDQYIQYMPDPADLALGAVGTIQINAGVPGSPELDQPAAPEETSQPPDPALDVAAIQQQNIGILNAMFVEGAGASQRRARVVTQGGFMILKNVNESVAGEQGTIEFTRNRMSPNEISIDDDGGIDRAFVRQEIQDLFDSDLLTYPYRDKSRIKIR
jgi:hypothetical protein